MTRRLLVSYLTITIVVLALFEIPLAVIYQQRETDRITADVERDAMVLATLYEESLENDQDLDPTRAEQYATDTNARVVVVDDEGVSRLDTGNDIDRDFATRPEIEIALTGFRSVGQRRSETLGVDLLYVAVPVASGGNVYGVVRLTLDTHEVDERIQRFWIGLVAAGMLILTVMGVVGWFIARSVTRPVRRLQRVASRFAGGDLAPAEIDRDAPTELTELQDGMNVMAARLDELMTRQRAFVADASHQLRTPLTALRLRLENLESDTNDSAVSHEIDEAINETTRLGALVDDLLQLARAEQLTPVTEIDLGEIVRDRVDTWSATAELHDVTLELDDSRDGPRAYAVAGGVEQILDNVLDNAIRVSPAGGTIEMCVSTLDDRCVVTIADGGPGLSDDDKIAAFQRFWRADTGGPGTGLGMAIAHNIAVASGGSISLADNSPKGLVVAIALPAIAAPSSDRIARSRRRLARHS